MDTDKILNLAKTMQKSFERKTRDDGSVYYAVKDDAPDWVNDVCREAHGNMLPDDYRYQFIVEAIDAIIDNEGETDSVELEADIYTADLTDWLASRVSRTEYVDTAKDEYGLVEFNLVDLLSAGQLYEKNEVLNQVVNALQEIETE